jgi:hypothetical protein
MTKAHWMYLFRNRNYSVCEAAFQQQDSLSSY